MMTMVILNTEIKGKKKVANLSKPKSESLQSTLYDRYLELKKNNYKYQRRQHIYVEQSKNEHYSL